MARYEYRSDDELPTMATLQIKWGHEQKTANGWMRRGWVMDDGFRQAVATVIEFNGPERQDGETKGLFRTQTVVDTRGIEDDQTSYIFMG